MTGIKEENRKQQIKSRLETEEEIEENETKKGKKRKANADGENVKEKSGKKKVKAKKTRKVAAKLIVGEKAADKVREKK